MLGRPAQAGLGVERAERLGRVGHVPPRWVPPAHASDEARAIAEAGMILRAQGGFGFTARRSAALGLACAWRLTFALVVDVLPDSDSAAGDQPANRGAAVTRPPFGWVAWVFRRSRCARSCQAIAVKRADCLVTPRPLQWFHGFTCTITGARGRRPGRSLRAPRTGWGADAPPCAG